MINKKPVLLFASAAALGVALHQGVQAEPIASEAAQTGAAAASAPTAAPAPVAEPAPETEANAATPDPQAANVGAAPPAPPVNEAAPAPATAPVSEAAAAPPAAAAPAEPTAETPQSPAQMDAAGERIEQRRAERTEARNRRYEELRARAAEVGLDLPQTPPWEQTGMPTPPAGAMPGMPGGKRSGITPEEREAQREQRYQMMRERAMQRGVELPESPPWKHMSEEERRAHREKMRNMAPEERRTMRDEHWQEMRKRAQEQGMDMPETPPWRQAEQRREEMKARRESYEATFDAMTDEQKEAVRALFGPGNGRFSQQPMGRQLPPGMPAQAPIGQQGFFGMPSGNWMPGYGPQGADPGMFERAPDASWFGGEQPMDSGPAPQWPGGNPGGLQGPPPPASGADFSQPW